MDGDGGDREEDRCPAQCWSEEDIQRGGEEWEMRQLQRNLRRGWMDGCAVADARWIESGGGGVRGRDGEGGVIARGRRWRG